MCRTRGSSVLSNGTTAPPSHRRPCPGCCMSAAGLPRSRPHPRLLHAHPDFVEVLLIDEGNARFLIGDNAYEVRAMDLIHI